MFKILVVLGRWSTSYAEPWTKAWTDKLLLKTRAFFLEASYGKVDIEWTVTPWLTPPQDIPPWTVFDPQLTALGFVKSQFNKTVFLTPRLTGYGKGYASGYGAWVAGGNDYAFFALPHELGHTLGLPHAQSLQIGTTEAVGEDEILHIPPLTVHTGGSRNSTGDRCSPMSYSGGLTHFSAPEKVRLGWITAETWDGAPRTYELVAASVAGLGTRAVMIPMGMFNSQRTYWLEYRTKTGWDAKIITENQGVQIRVTGDFNCYPACAMDAHMRPDAAGSNYNSTRNMAMWPGDSFEDGTVNVKFTHVGTDGKAVVVVTALQVPPVPPVPPAGTLGSV
jgi:hypothetical protein